MGKRSGIAAGSGNIWYFGVKAEVAEAGVAEGRGEKVVMVNEAEEGD
jgi:hypothetical protein